MDIRWIPKGLLWILLILSSLGAVSSWVRPNTDQLAAFGKFALEQQMAISAATNFAREWMNWGGEESLEDRQVRLKPYVSQTVTNRVNPIKAEQKGSQQKVISAEFISLSSKGTHEFTVRIRVVVQNPARAVWEVEVPVWVQSGRGASVTAPPIIRPLQEAPIVPEISPTEAVASGDVKQRMKPFIESFLKAMCEGKNAESLFNYVSTGSKLTPLQGRIRMLSLDSFEVTGVGPYNAKVAFTAQDAATGFSFTQVWQLKVTEETQKYFVYSIE